MREELIRREKTDKLGRPVDWQREESGGKSRQSFSEQFLCSRAPSALF